MSVRLCVMLVVFAFGFVGSARFAAMASSALADTSQAAASNGGAEPVATSLSEQEIDKAIEWGLSEKKPHAYLYGPIVGGIVGSLFKSAGIAVSVVATGPFGRVAAEAAEAKKKYVEFRRENVSPDALLPFLVVLAEPPAPATDDQTRRDMQPTQIQHIVLQAKKKGSPAIQPIETRTEAFEWENNFGAVVSRAGMRALFALKDVPTEEFEIVIISDKKEQRALVGKKQLDLLH